MTRKESEKDSERPHYYSQFWLDVAAGRKIIGGPKTNDEADFEPELETEPVALRKPVRSSSTAMDDGYGETIAHPEIEPEFDADEFAEPEIDELELENEVEDEDIAIPDAIVDEIEIPDVDLTPIDEEIDEEEMFEDEDEDEDAGWGGGRGRKKPKPGRQVKQPKKPPRREPRRGY